MVGETDGRGLLECCKRFPDGGEQLLKRTHLCGAGFSRKAKPHTPPHRMNAPCAFLEGGRAIAEKYAPVRRGIFAQG